MSGGDVGAELRGERHLCFAGLGRGDRREECELISVDDTAPLDENGGEEREGGVDRGACSRIPVGALRFECRALETRERGAQLLVRAAVRLASHAAEKGMQREADDAVRGALASWKRRHSSTYTS